MGPAVQDIDPSQFATNEVILPNLLPMRSWSIVAGAQALSKGAIAAILVWILVWILVSCGMDHQTQYTGICEIPSLLCQ
jgi:hypothetical protein